MRQRRAGRERVQRAVGAAPGVLAPRHLAGNVEGAHLLGKVRPPQSLADLTAPWKGVGIAMGDTSAEPSDAGNQLATAARLLAEAERIASDARWRRDQSQAA